jgi:hypothetical protein
MTNGKAGVIHPAAIGSPKIMGLEVIKKLAIKQAAIASSNDNPKAIPTGAAASAVAPDMTKPCKNSAVNSLVCMKGILSVNGPHFIPFLFIFFPYSHFDNSAIPSSKPFNVKGYILLSNKSLKMHTDDV